LHAALPRRPAGWRCNLRRQLPSRAECCASTWCERPIQGFARDARASSSSSSDLPLRDDGRRFATHAQALAELDPPRPPEDRAAYRLLDIGLRADGVELSFSRGSYFDVIDVCETVAHEFAAGGLAGGASGVAPAMSQLPLRASIGDPTDLARRP
jgi:hypothetical protein